MVMLVSRPPTLPMTDHSATCEINSTLKKKKKRMITHFGFRLARTGALGGLILGGRRAAVK